MSKPSHCAVCGEILDDQGTCRAVSCKSNKPTRFDLPMVGARMPSAVRPRSGEFSVAKIEPALARMKRASRED